MDKENEQMGGRKENAERKREEDVSIFKPDEDRCGRKPQPQH